MNFFSKRQGGRSREIFGGGTALFLVAAYLLLLGSVATAQAQGLDEEARNVLRQGQQRAAEAMTRYSDHYPDQPLWREAIALGLRAQRLAPERTEPYRFLGQVYSVTGWYSRAWAAWQSYRERGGEIDAQARSQLLAAATWLGFNSYSSGNYRQALPYLEEALNLNPHDRLTLSRLSQSHIALDDPAAALPYAEALAELDPDAGGLLERVEAYLTYGVEAVDAVRQGESHYASGRADEALQSFRRAVELNSNYPAALRWAGRAALEFDRPGEAANYWRRLVELNPADEEALEGLSLAQNRDRFGADAYGDYQDGREAYERGDRVGAQRLLEAALALNSDIPDAHALLGRLHFERGDFSIALERFEQAVRLAPADSSYRFYLSATEEQLRLQEQALALAAERERAAAEERQQAAEAERALEQARAQQEAEERARAQAQAEEQAVAEAQAEAAQALAEQEAEEEAAREQAAQEQAAQEQAAQEQAAEQARAEAQAEAEAQAAAEQTAAEARAQAEAEADAQAEAEARAAPPVAETPNDRQQQQITEEVVAGAAAPAQPAASPTPAPSAGLVVADLSFTHESAEEGGSGAFSFLSGNELTRNLSSPINYASGTLFQRLEVRSKPSDVPVHYQLCLVPNDSISVQPACTTSDLLVFNEEGVFEAQQLLSSLSGFGGIDWENGLESVILVIKDPSGLPVDNRYLLGDGSRGPPDSELYYPMEVRFTALVVPEGASFPGWPQ
ncbi:MAG: tetratricopeptide repeat protein [Trueperaceae bacterium]